MAFYCILLGFPGEFLYSLEMLHHKPAIGHFTRKILAERQPEQVPLFTNSEDRENDASGGVIVNAAPAPKTEAHIDNAPYTAGGNGSLSESREQV